MEKLGINLTGLIGQAINFGLLVFLLYRFLLKPILKMLDERRQRIAQGLEEAEQARRELALIEQEREKLLAEARQKAQEISARATQRAQKMRDEILAQAHQEARQLLEKAQQEIERERQQALTEARRQVTDLSLLMTQKVVGKALSEDDHRRLIGQFLEEEADWR